MIKVLIQLILYFTFISSLFCQSHISVNKGMKKSKEEDKRTWALIVGISKYENIPSLDYADKDAISFYDFLVSYAGGKVTKNDIKLLLNEDATSYNIISALDLLLDSVQQNESVYIYFSGHADTENKTKDKYGYLLGYSSPKFVYPAGGCIPVDYLNSCCRTLSDKNARVILIIDACKAGKLAGGDEGRQATALALQSDWKGVCKILSCQPSEVSLESPQWGNGGGVFTFCLLKGLRGLADYDKEGNITLYEIGKYLQENVYAESDKQQLPEVTGNKKEIISQVDKSTYLALLKGSEIKSDLASNTEKKGFEPNVSSINDNYVLNQYKKFQIYINSNKLINYSDTLLDDNNAFQVYLSVNDNPNASILENSMKRTLLAALQNKAQISLNSWLNSQQAPDSISDYKTYKDLKTAISIIDTSYYFYNSIKSKLLLWESFHLSDQNKKIGILNECIKMEPLTPDYYFEIANIYYNNTKFDSALSFYNYSIELAPKWSWAWHNKGLALLSLEKYEDAIQCFNTAISLKPDDYFSWVHKGLAYENSGKYDEAIICYDSALKIKPDYSLALFNKGNALLVLKKYSDAISNFEIAIEKNPNYLDAWINKGNAYYYLNNNDEALKCYNKVIEIKPDCAEGFYNKGAIYSKLKNKEEMKKNLIRAIGINPQFKDSAKEDPDYRNYWDDIDFKSIVK